MSAFDRMERRLPDLLSELAPAQVPDYFDDMLRKAERTPQRPAWSAIERWIPMGVIAQTERVRVPSWRPVAILAILILATLIGMLLFAGSQPKLPEPFGPARNGIIVVGTTDGDIVAIDPSTGTTTTILGRPSFDVEPWFSNDGRRLFFVRSVTPVGDAIDVANVDGTAAREIAPAGPLGTVAVSPNGDRIAITRAVDPDGSTLMLYGVAGGTRRCSISAWRSRTLCGGRTAVSSSLLA